MFSYKKPINSKVQISLNFWLISGRIVQNVFTLKSQTKLHKNIGNITKLKSENFVQF